MSYVDGTLKATFSHFDRVIKWEEHFFRLVYAISLKSKDESTKFGAIIVNRDNTVISTGYNSFPRELNDTVPERQIRPEKYKWFAHSERNAIYNAARIGVSTQGCKMYTQGMPCPDCAIAIIQSGITNLFIHSDWEECAKGIFGEWDDRHVVSKTMFSECGVGVSEVYGKISNDAMTIKTCIRGKWFEV